MPLLILTTFCKVLLQWYEELAIKLNLEKMQLRKKEVPSIGHVATGQGLCVDLPKVKSN